MICAESYDPIADEWTVLEDEDDDYLTFFGECDAKAFIKNMIT